MVAEPGKGSLTVTGPTGELVGARSDNELEALSGKAGPIGSGVGQVVQRGIGEDVLAPGLLSQMSSGNGRRPDYAIKLLPPSSRHTAVTTVVSF